MSVIEKLIRFHKFDLDEKRRHLRVFEEQEARIQATIDAIDREVQAEQAFSRREANFAPYYGGYSTRTKSQLEELELELANAHKAVKEARETVIQAFEELKKFEIRKEQQKQNSDLESELRERINLDEIALTSHQRRDN